MVNGAASGRYSRQVLFDPIGDEGQARLEKAHVALVGCGALGTVSAERLSRAGTGSLRIIDRDFVELNNLQRQVLFTEEHARERMPKSVAAASVLASINSEVKIEPVVGDLTPTNVEELIAGCDLAIDGTDNLETRFLLNDACLKAGIPWIHGAAVGSCGQEMVILPDRGACYRCYLTEVPGFQLQGCDVLGVLNTVTGIVAELQATHAIQLVTGASIRGGILRYVDVWEGDFQQIEVKKLPDCPACGRGEYSFLNRESTSWSTSLCGRNAVQISPAEDRRWDLDDMLSSLSAIGTVESNGYLLTFSTGDYEITVFPNGRAIIKGTTDVQLARSLYSRYLSL